MRLALILASLMFTAGQTPGLAQDAGARYTTAYRVAGIRLRATYVCPGDKKAMMGHALDSVSSPEFVTFSKAYPKTIEKWMGEGADMFNEEVMKDGVDEACRRAR